MRINILILFNFSLERMKIVSKDILKYALEIVKIFIMLIK